MARSNFTVALLPLLALSFAAVGCDSNVVGGGDDGDDSYDETEPRDGGPGEDEDGAEPDLPIDPSSNAFVEVQGGVATLAFASFPVTCGVEPLLGYDCDLNEKFTLVVRIPADRLVGGTTIDLADPSVESFTEVLGKVSGDSCSFGGGTGFGTVELVSVDASHVVAWVEDAFMTVDTPSRLGFDMTRCDVTTEPAESNAIGFRLGANDDGDDGDDGDTGSSGQTGGGGTEEDRFVIQIANHTAATCGDHYAMPECPFEARDVSVSIPASRNFEGSVIDLADETNFVGFSDQGPNEDGTCWWGGGGGALPGTLTLWGAAGGTMDVTFAGTGDALLDGSHVVVVCD